MNAGLPQGFVRLDSQNALILRTLHQLGPMTVADLLEETGIILQGRSGWPAALTRLVAARFVYLQPKAGGHGSSEPAMCMLALEPNRNREAYKPDSGTVRNRRYRERKSAQTLTHGWLRGLA